MVIILAALKEAKKLPSFISFDSIAVFSGFLPLHRDVYDPVRTLVSELQATETLIG